jgi:hypothetical protein
MAALPALPEDEEEFDDLLDHSESQLWCSSETTVMARCFDLKGRAGWLSSARSAYVCGKAHLKVRRSVKYQCAEVCMDISQVRSTLLVLVR